MVDMPFQDGERDVRQPEYNFPATLSSTTVCPVEATVLSTWSPAFFAKGGESGLN